VFHWDKTLARGERMHHLISSLDIPAAPPAPVPPEVEDDDELE
jgi:hypothetical protein